MTNLRRLVSGTESLVMIRNIALLLCKPTYLSDLSSVLSCMIAEEQCGLQHESKAGILLGSSRGMIEIQSNQGY